MEESTSSSKKRTNQHTPMLTPPTPRVNSFSCVPNLDGAAATDANEQADLAIATKATPPTTSSSLKHSKNVVSPDSQHLNHDGLTPLEAADPPLTDLLPGSRPSQSHPPQHRQQPRLACSSSLGATSCRSHSVGHQNNTIVNTIRELGARKYLQLVNDPRFLPVRLRPEDATSDSSPSLRTSTRKRRKAPLTQPRTAKRSSKPTRQAADKQITLSDSDSTTAPASKVTAQTSSKRNKASKPELPPAKPSMACSKTTAQTTRRKRKVSELEPDLQAQESESASTATEPEAEPLPKKSKPSSSTTTPTKSARTKPKSRKTPKKASIVSASKPEKSRTKEQRWGDYLKGIVGGEKDVYGKLPDQAIPPIGPLIDHTPVRPYAFNKGKVQDYGSGDGLHVREQELAREVGLSYDAYRQQKRMAFIGYAAMQLEGKKEFKKSHTQSMCNIDGNKATHLWLHFHDTWGWMPEHPNPPITTASLGDLQLPDLHVVEPQA